MSRTPSTRKMKRCLETAVVAGAVWLSSPVAHAESDLKPLLTKMSGGWCQVGTSSKLACDADFGCYADREQLDITRNSGSNVTMDSSDRVRITRRWNDKIDASKSFFDNCVYTYSGDTISTQCRLMEMSMGRILTSKPSSGEWKRCDYSVDLTAASPSATPSPLPAPPPPEQAPPVPTPPTLPEDPVKYDAILSCGMGNGNINILACFIGKDRYSPSTELEVSIDGQQRLLKGYMLAQLPLYPGTLAIRKVRKLPSEMAIDEDGLHIFLTNTFSIRAQNSNNMLVLRMTIIDMSNGKIVYMKEAGHFGVISISNH